MEEEDIEDDEEVDDEDQDDGDDDDGEEADDKVYHLTYFKLFIGCRTHQRQWRPGWKKLGSIDLVLGDIQKSKHTL